MFSEIVTPNILQFPNQSKLFFLLSDTSCLFFKNLLEIYKNLSNNCISQIKSFRRLFKKSFLARHQWLMLVILATQVAKIRRIMVQSQPRQIVGETLSKICNTKKGW
jgi:hypothetical protein